MENEQRPLPYFRLEMEDGSEFTCNPQNTHAFLHSQQPDGDHVFPYVMTENNEVVDGHYVFREQIPHFDLLIGRMALSGYAIHRKDVLSEEDQEAFDEFKARKELNVRLQAAARQEAAYNLTPRQEARPLFLRYLLDFGHLLPNDFKGQGDLLI